MSSRRIKIGEIGVDAGLCWIGDPCYIFHKGADEIAKALGNSWGDFCRMIGSGNPTMKQYRYDAGHAGLGVLVSTGVGDGVYPVYATVETVDSWGERVTSVQVDFFPGEREYGLQGEDIDAAEGEE